MSSQDRCKSPIPDSVSPSVSMADQIVAAIPDLIFEFTPDGHFAALHAGHSAVLYCPPGEFLGKHYSAVLPDKVARDFGEQFQKALSSGKPTRMSYSLPVDDEIRFYESRFLPMDSGCVLGLVRDITDSWRSKTELRQSETQYRTLVNNIPGLVYRCRIDEDWTAVYISPAVESLTGYPAEDFMARRRSLSSVTHPEDRGVVRREVLAALEQRRPFHLSYRMIDRDGGIRHVTERGQPVYAEHDEVEYLDGVVFDVTDIHQMRQRVLINSKMAAVGNLAAGVAHEINNPLTIAMANLEFVADELAAGDDGDDGDEVETAIEKVQDGIARVRNIIDDLRSFTDAADSRADQIDLQRLTSWAVQRTQKRIGAVRAEQIITELTPVSLVWASEVGVVQVIWNLLDNGLEAISRRDDDGGCVQVSLHDDEERVILQICDDGPGMADEVAQRAFEPFFTTKTVGQGAGLGLFVCKGLVEGMDGQLDLETSPGEGTCIQITFPAFRPHYSEPGGH